jgi:hypothetical protein
MARADLPVGLPVFLSRARVLACFTVVATAAHPVRPAARVLAALLVMRLGFRRRLRLGRFLRQGDTR